MDIGVISVRYARALLKSATDAKLEDAVYQQMQLLAKSYVEVSQLRQTIDNPMLAKEKKEMLLPTDCSLYLPRPFSGTACMYGIQ
jgi:F-type H+-transporting ATPase subunit delta